MNDNFKEKIQLFSSHKLCEIIATCRYLGSMQPEAIACMEELVKRRVNNDDFDFENQIDIEYKKLPNFKDVDMSKKMNIGTNIGILKGLKLV